MKKYNKFFKYIFKVISIIILLSSALFAQTKKEIERKKAQNIKEIQYINSLLKQTKENKSVSLDQLKQIKRKIQLRENTIYLIDNQIRGLDKQIGETSQIIDALENDLKILKDEYVKMLNYAYKNRNSYNRMLFIFSSNSFDQAYKRLKYLQQYTQYRERQAELIVLTQQMLSEKVNRLQKKRTQKLILLESRKVEMNLLDNERVEKDRLVIALESKETQLLSELKEKQSQAEKLKKELDRIIAEEIRKRQQKLAEKGKSNTLKSLPLTPDEQLLSGEFTSNKGTLPWPVERGFVSEQFGEHPHPILKEIMIKNNGIDIHTDKGAQARSVFEGEVTGVIVITGSNKAIIIRHGEYMTVYSNLSDVFVARGDKVDLKQVIGLVSYDNINDKTELHFELWKGNQLINPTYWLAKQK